MREKFYPNVGDHLYLRQLTGNEWVDMCRYPYTVIKVDKNRVWVQSCELVFNGPRYYDTLPDDIKEDPYGDVRELKWSNAKKLGGAWVYKNYPGDTYPSFAVFGEWDYQGYLN